MIKFGTAIWNGALMLLAVAALVMFWGFVAFGIYGVVQWSGFDEKAAYWSAGVSSSLAGVLCYSRISRVTLTTCALTSLVWLLIALFVLLCALAVLVVIMSPPSLYSLAVAGLILLAGILWQLTKIANKR
jgi:hypothetical protein